MLSPGIVSELVDYILGPFFRRVVVPTDTAQTAVRKKVMVAMHLAAFICGFATVARTPLLIANGDRLTARWLCFAMAMGIGAMGLLYILCTKTAPDTYVKITLYLYLFAFLVADWGAAALDTLRPWALAIVLLDIGLVCGVGNKVSFIIIGVMCFWFVLTTAEGIVRFGLYDSPYFLDTQSFRQEWYTCDNLPCERKADFMLITMLVQIMLYLVDFHITSSFATGLRDEHAKIEAAIIASEDIAISLSRFDLRSAEEILKKNPSLPPQLREGFNSILANLTLYKPYLPQSCLVNDVNQHAPVKESSGVFSKEESASLGHRGSPTPSRTFYLNNDGGTSVILQDSSSRMSRMSSDSAAKPTNLFNSIEKRNAGFVVFNKRRSHSGIVENLQGFQDEFDSFITAITSSLSSHSGVVNVVIGDHVYASFNTSKKCVNYTNNAFLTSLEVKDSLAEKNIAVCIGISSGWAYCGPLGSSDLKCLATIGPSVVTASYIEKFCSHNDMAVVCTSSVYKETAHVYTLRLVLTKLSIPHLETLVLCYEVLHGQKSSVNDVEWMYQLQGKEWDRYNEAGRSYLLGKNEDAFKALETGPEELSDAESDLLNMMKDKIEVRVLGMV